MGTLKTLCGAQWGTLSPQIDVKQRPDSNPSHLRHLFVAPEPPAQRVSRSKTVNTTTANMSLFHRRSRSQSASRPQTPASASAHMAASQAFLANRVSQGNLSASAAAAALRNLSPTPTPIDQLQTKRMIQRLLHNHHCFL